MFNDNQIKILNDSLDSSRIKSRSKGNVSLSYLEGFDIIETANRVFGYGNWSYHISSLTQVSQETNQNQNMVVCYKAVVEVKISNEPHNSSICRQDVGFGTGIAKTLADAHESGAKESVTDALKRAMRSFGNQFGNSLYNKEKNHHPNSNYNQSANNQQNKAHQSNQQPYKHQQDFHQLTNLGLSVIQQGDNLIVVGENIFANKEVIKSNGFRWDSASKSWYMQLSQAA
jgi:DNA repair and recombination protein RAD52